MEAITVYGEEGAYMILPFLIKMHMVHLDQFDVSADPIHPTTKEKQILDQALSLYHLIPTAPEEQTPSTIQAKKDSLQIISDRYVLLEKFDTAEVYIAQMATTDRIHAFKTIIKSHYTQPEYRRRIQAYYEEIMQLLPHITTEPISKQIDALAAIYYMRHVIGDTESIKYLAHQLTTALHEEITSDDPTARTNRRDIIEQIYFIGINQLYSGWLADAEETTRILETHKQYDQGKGSGLLTSQIELVHANTLSSDTVSHGEQALALLKQVDFKADAETMIHFYSSFTEQITIIIKQLAKQGRMHEATTLLATQDSIYPLIEPLSEAGKKEIQTHYDSSVAAIKLFTFLGEPHTTDEYVAACQNILIDAAPPTPSPSLLEEVSMEGYMAVVQQSVDRADVPTSLDTFLIAYQEGRALMSMPTTDVKTKVNIGLILTAGLYQLYQQIQTHNYSLDHNNFIKQILTLAEYDRNPENIPDEPTIDNLDIGIRLLALQTRRTGETNATELRKTADRLHLTIPKDYIEDQAWLPN